MTKHTKGPWTCEYTGYENGLRQIICGDAAYPYTGNQPLNVIALCKDHNAQLIAAAPELLEALKLLMSYDSPIEEGAYEHPYVKQSLQAIAKAEGRE